jgi:hypothetical protein
MNDSIIRAKTRTYPTGQASLAAFGVLIQQQRLLEPIRATVQIAQKTIQHSPTDKLIDALIGMLAGAKGMVEVNTKVRSDVAVQRAFGRRACAEQSTIQDTLDHSTVSNVAQLRLALHQIFVSHSAAFWHDYSHGFQILDIDLTGLPCGPKAAFATKGYFDGQYHRRGRQLGRIIASQSDEVVVDCIFAGNTHLGPVLTDLLSSAEQILGLDQDSDADRRAHTLLRLDAAGGGLESCNWLLSRGYQLLTKDYSSQRASRLAASVTRWVEDPRCSGRQIGWVMTPTSEYVRPVLRLAVRCRTKRGGWRPAVLVSSIWPEEALSQVFLSPEEWASADAETLALLYLYDARGGGAETSFHGDKQGLGMRRRTKRHWEGQQMLTLLGSLAHNLVVWSRRLAAMVDRRLRQYGIERMVRDVFQLHGWVVLNGWQQVIAIKIVATIPLAEQVIRACRELFGMHSIVVTLGKT